MIQAWLEDYRIYAEYERVRLLDAEGQTLLPYPQDYHRSRLLFIKRIPEVLQSKQVTMVEITQQKRIPFTSISLFLFPLWMLKQAIKPSDWSLLY